MNGVGRVVSLFTVLHKALTPQSGSPLHWDPSFTCITSERVSSHLLAEIDPKLPIHKKIERVYELAMDDGPPKIGGGKAKLNISDIMEVEARDPVVLTNAIKRFPSTVTFNLTDEIKKHKARDDPIKELKGEGEMSAGNLVGYGWTLKKEHFVKLLIPGKTQQVKVLSDLGLIETCIFPLCDFGAADGSVKGK